MCARVGSREIKRSSILPDDSLLPSAFMNHVKLPNALFSPCTVMPRVRSSLEITPFLAIDQISRQRELDSR